jgi:hypothetical protein
MNGNGIGARLTDTMHAFGSHYRMIFGASDSFYGPLELGRRLLFISMLGK